MSKTPDERPVSNILRGGKTNSKGRGMYLPNAAMRQSNIQLTIPSLLNPQHPTNLTNAPTPALASTPTHPTAPTHSQPPTSTSNIEPLPNLDPVSTTHLPSSSASAALPDDPTPTELDDAYADPEAPPTSKYKLEPAHPKSYIHSNLGTKAISNVFKSRLRAGYYTVKSLPQQELDSWFEDWKKYCYWDPQHEGHMKIAFSHRLGLRMSGIYYTIRTKGKKPDWMLEEVYNVLRAYWDTPEFIRLSNRNKGNRRSKEGAATYAGGSISISTRNKLKEQQTKEPVTIRSSFADNFVKKADREKAPEELPPGRVRDCLVSYDVLEAEQKQRLSGDPDCHVLTEDELWSTAAGGPNKKGEVLGMNYKRKKSLLTDDGGTSSHEKYTTPDQVQSIVVSELGKNELRMQTFITTQLAQFASMLNKSG